MEILLFIKNHSLLYKCLRRYVFMPLFALVMAAKISPCYANAAKKVTSRDPIEDVTPDVTDEVSESIPTDYKPLRNFKEGFSYLLDKQNLWTIGIGAAGVVGAQTLGFDDEARDYFRFNRRIGDLDDLGNHYLGTGMPSTVLGAGFWLIGELTNRPYAVHAGQAQLEALLVTGILTTALKTSFKRDRPDHSDQNSFTSGHTANIFTTATVLNEFYGWKVGVPLFALGALTAVGRMSEDRHWLSDTIGGATLGIVVGHAFSRAHLERIDKNQGKKKKFTLYPKFEEGGAQLVFKTTF